MLGVVSILLCYGVFGKFSVPVYVFLGADLQCLQHHTAMIWVVILGYGMAQSLAAGLLLV
jgi:hypothetical protein